MELFADSRLIQFIIIQMKCVVSYVESSKSTRSPTSGIRKPALDPLRKIVNVIRLCTGQVTFSIKKFHAS